MIWIEEKIVGACILFCIFGDYSGPGTFSLASKGIERHGFVLPPLSLACVSHFFALLGGHLFPCQKREVLTSDQLSFPYLGLRFPGCYPQFSFGLCTS